MANCYACVHNQGEVGQMHCELKKDRSKPYCRFWKSRYGKKGGK